jgi:hypothetical protein
MRDRARQEAAWARRAAVRYAAEAKRRIRARMAGKGRRWRSTRVSSDRGRGGGAEETEAFRPVQQVLD